MASRRRRAAAGPGRRRNVLVAGTAVAVVAGGGGVAWAMTSSSGPSYRLASVTRATVQQTVDTSGTVVSANSATLSFPVSGTVASVGVALGQHVRAGQTVATLDTSALQQQLRDAQATAAGARQTLAGDEASQTNAGSSSSGSSSNPAATATPTPTSTRSSGVGSNPTVAQVRAAQQQVLADQRAADLDSDVAAADKAVAAANTACAALLGATPTPTATPTATATAAGSPAGTDLQSCQDAIAAVQTAQHAVQADIDALTADEAALDRAVSELLKSLAAGSSTSPGASTPTGRASQPTGRASQPTSRSSGGVATAADLAADQARVDAADAQVTVARQNVAQAALTTPISGTVGAISISAGQQVGAGSSTATITVIGAGQKEVTTTVGIADIDLVKKGETAHVTVDGTSTPMTGEVTQVGFLNTSGTSGSTTTYPVTIVLDTAKALYDGAGASVSIDVGAAGNVLTVPTSAVHTTGRFATLSVYRNGKVSTVPVTLGIEDSDRTEIRTGVSAGEQVVLADIGAPVPTSGLASNIARRLGGGGLGGGLGGGGLGGGQVVTRNGN